MIVRSFMKCLLFIHFTTCLRIETNNRGFLSKYKKYSHNLKTLECRIGRSHSSNTEVHLMLLQSTYSFTSNSINHIN